MPGTSGGRPGMPDLLCQRGQRGILPTAGVVTQRAYGPERARDAPPTEQDGNQRIAQCRRETIIPGAWQVKIDAYANGFDKIELETAVPIAAK